jgi:uncharacterized protein
MTHEHDHEHDHDHDHEHHHEHVSYADALQAYRADKDEAFRESDDSPIPRDNRSGFLGLRYFPINESLRFEGLTLSPYAGTEPVRFEIPTTDGQSRPYERAGTFEFQVDGQPLRLTAYESDDLESGQLFVPFMDATTGSETYGGGRYLDLEQDADGAYALDFNLAYHPLCVYDPKYSCPLTPQENRLPVRIEAGERL